MKRFFLIICLLISGCLPVPAQQEPENNSAPGDSLAFGYLFIRTPLNDGGGTSAEINIAGDINGGGASVIGFYQKAGSQVFNLSAEQASGAYGLGGYLGTLDYHPFTMTTRDGTVLFFAPKSSTLGYLGLFNSDTSGTVLDDNSNSGINIFNLGLSSGKYFRYYENGIAYLDRYIVTDTIASTGSNTVQESVDLNLIARGDTGEVVMTASRVRMSSPPYETKAFSYTGISAGDSSFVFEVRQYGTTLREIRVMRTGGTSASVNATRDRGGSVVDLLTANYASTTSMASAGTLQNTTLNVGDIIRVTVRAISGTVTELVFQFSFDQPGLN